MKPVVYVTKPGAMRKARLTQRRVTSEQARARGVPRRYHHRILMKTSNTFEVSKAQVTWLRDDDWITLASLDADLTEEIMKEFDLTPLDGYLIRAQQAQDEQRSRK